ncbi:hypothetical protein C1H46_036767 [Malus baccata]|uniref:Uncharacterized protein n=1 Tax=Malus baccata TaxID=106549 RepID=A0A540KU14_MALBA|nr:hypothetical protein C1H46_036767 [Malus baccata]
MSLSLSIFLFLSLSRDSFSRFSLTQFSLSDTQTLIVFFIQCTVHRFSPKQAW